MRLFAVLLTVALCSCASVPKEAPLLSAELGQRIQSIEAAHLRMTKDFFEARRARIDAFLYEEWLPRFAENFFEEPTISDAWEEIAASGSREDRLQFLLLVGPRLQDAVNRKHQELVAPIDEIEARVVQELEHSYDEALAINNSLTSYLSSAADVEANRARYMEALGIRRDDTLRLLSGLDQAVGQLVSATEAGANLVERQEAYRARLEALRDSMRSSPEN